jgi:hypothetical protein
MSDKPSSYPTTSDISELMRWLGYTWSNEAQTYYDYNFHFISRKSAEKLYEVLIGDKPFTQLVVNGVDILKNKK